MMTRRNVFKYLLGIPSAIPLTITILAADEKVNVETNENVIYGRIRWNKQFPLDESTLDAELQRLKTDIIQIVRKNGK